MQSSQYIFAHFMRCKFRDFLKNCMSIFLHFAYLNISQCENLYSEYCSGGFREFRGASENSPTLENQKISLETTPFAYFENPPL